MFIYFAEWFPFNPDAWTLPARMLGLGSCTPKPSTQATRTICWRWNATLSCRSIPVPARAKPFHWDTRVLGRQRETTSWKPTTNFRSERICNGHVDIRYICWLFILLNCFTSLTRILRNSPTYRGGPLDDEQTLRGSPPSNESFGVLGANRCHVERRKDACSVSANANALP